jgi:multiple sugar transport system substrate-binding protein
LVTDVPSATILFEQSALAPASKVISEKIPAIRSDKFQTAFRDAITEHAQATPYDKIPTGAAIDTAISTGTANIMAGQVSVQDGLNQLKSTVQGLLDASKS